MILAVYDEKGDGCVVGWWVVLEDGQGHLRTRKGGLWPLVDQDQDQPARCPVDSWQTGHIMTTPSSPICIDSHQTSNMYEN